jgi:DNA-binding transcriptional LysR family regulator
MPRARRRFVWEIDWNLLRTFTVIVQEKSLTAAGQKLLLRQPTISNALKRLEDHVGCRLIDRTSTTFQITPAGERLYGECLALFNIVSGLPDVIEEKPGEIAGHVEMAFTSYVVCPFFDAFLASFHLEFPRITFSTTVTSSDEATQRVLNQEACLAICLAYEKHPGLDYIPLYRENFGFFCAQGHPLYGRQDVGIEALRSLDYVTFRTDRMGDALWPIAQLRQKENFNGQTIGLFSNLEEVKRLIKAGFGFGPLPVHVVEDEIRSGQLWRLPPYQDTPTVDVEIVVNRAARRPKAEALFIDRLVAAIDRVPLAERTYPLAGQPFPKPVRKDVRLSPSSGQR